MSADQSTKAREKKSREFFRSVRAAFSSWWSVLGIVMASVTAFNLARNLLPNFQVASVLSHIAETYQSVVYYPLWWILAWFSWPRPPAWAVDMAIIWLLIGGVMLRSVWHMMRQQSKRNAPSPIVGVLMLVYGVGVALVFWPLLLARFLASPLAFDDGQEVSLLNRTDANDPSWQDVRGKFLYDLRIVLVTQALACVTCIMAFLTLNSVLHLYGEG